MKFISLFSGIGGFDLGLSRAGMQCISQVEIDAACLGILSRHYPEVEKQTDVRLYSYDGSADLICGGFPCQDLSVAGRRAGLAGGRSGLWFEFHRILENTRPKWVVIENVPGLLSSNKGQDFAIILQGLAQLGYGVAWRVLDAQYFGVPQRRRRVFIVGHLGDGRAAEVLFERESSSGSAATCGKEGQANTTAALRSSGHDYQGQPISTDPVIVGTLDKKCTSSDRGSQSNETSFLVPVNNHTSLAAFGGNNCSGEINVATTLNAAKNIRYDFGTETFITAKDQPIVWHNRQQSGDIRIQKDTVCSIIKSWGTGGNNVPFVGVRRLTPTECERLQGFPDGWTAGQSDTTRYRQLGNAVCVPVIEWLGHRIMEAET